VNNPLRSDVPYRIDAKAGAKLRARAIVWDIISVIPAVSDFTGPLSFFDFRSQFKKQGVTYHLINPKSPGKSIFLFVLELIPVASIYWAITKRVEGEIQQSREEDEQKALEEKKKMVRRFQYKERYRTSLDDTGEDEDEYEGASSTGAPRFSSFSSTTRNEKGSNSPDTNRPDWEHRDRLYKRT
jgi:hypothetical protein